MTPEQRASLFLGQRASPKYVEDFIRQIKEAENGALDRAAAHLEAEYEKGDEDEEISVIGARFMCAESILSLKHKDI